MRQNSQIREELAVMLRQPGQTIAALTLLPHSMCAGFRQQTRSPPRRRKRTTASPAQLWLDLGALPDPVPLLPTVPAPKPVPRPRAVLALPAAIRPPVAATAPRARPQPPIAVAPATRRGEARAAPQLVSLATECDELAHRAGRLTLVDRRDPERPHLERSELAEDLARLADRIREAAGLRRYACEVDRQPFRAGSIRAGRRVVQVETR